MKFKIDEIQIEEETDQFISTKEYLEKELNTISLSNGSWGGGISKFQ